MTTTVRDFTGHERKFTSEEVANLFEKIDRLEESIYDKYFMGDVEYNRGKEIAQKIKGQLRRIDKDLALLAEIEKEGMPAERDDD